MGIYRVDNQKTEITFECGGIVERTVQNAKNLLMTRMGEVPYDRCRGFDPALYDLPIAELRERLMPELDRVMLWEPDVTVKAANVYLNAAGEAVIEADLKITIDEH